MKLSSPNKKIITYAIKLTIALATIGYLAYKFLIEREHEEFLSILKRHLANISWQLIGLVALLTLVNWGIEAIKWRTLLLKYEKISLVKAFSAILSGVTVSLFTPNRIGEYAGRVFHLKTFDKIKASLLTVVGSLSQLTITLVVGILAFAFFLSSSLNISGYSLYLIRFLGLLIITLAILLFFNLGIMVKVFDKVPWLKKYGSYLAVVHQVEQNILLKLLILSFIRYSIFTIQYALLLQAFSVGVPFGQSLMVIAVIFLVQTSLPSFTLAEMGIRGAAAVYFFNYYTTNDTAVVLSAYSLWVMNIIIPALAGLVTIVNLRFFEE